VETGGQPNEGRDAVGDGGAALGPYQIHREYWQDAVERDKSLGGTYEDVKDPAYAERVVRAYMARYAPKGADFETLARIHNGGPKGAKKESTMGYWGRVKAALPPEEAKAPSAPAQPQETPMPQPGQFDATKVQTQTNSTDALMSQFSEDNRLTFPQFVALQARFADRYGVSSIRAQQIALDTLKQRQKLLDEQAVAAGGQPYQPSAQPAAGR
jgi:hypothetical protein